MATAFQFSAAQILELTRLRNEALARGSVVGAFKPVYDYLATQIQLAQYSGVDAAEVERVRIWLLGGSQVNGHVRCHTLGVTH